MFVLLPFIHFRLLPPIWMGVVEGEWGALVSWLFCVYCVSGAMWVVQLGWNQSFNFRFKFFNKSAFYMISVEMH